MPALSNRISVREGDLIRVMTTGGGGWGDPADREPELVREDVLQGKVGAESAMRHYGVIFKNQDNFALDEEGTIAFRKLMKSRRKKLGFFDRGPGFDALREASLQTEKKQKPVPGKSR